MDMKKLLESIDSMQSAEKHPTGPKFTGYWKGSDKAKPGNKMVGGNEEEESVEPDLKGLKKISEEQAVEWRLQEMWANFNEEDLGTHPKRPTREGARHHRGHEPHPQYKTIKADEAAGKHHYKWEITFKDGKKAVYHHDSPHYSDATAASDIRSTLKSNPGAKVVATKDDKPFDWQSQLSEAGSPAQQAAIAIAMKKAGKKPKNEGAEQDPIVAKVVKQMRPGLTGLDMGNEAFLYFAYELGKQRARDAWSDYLPAIRSAYEQGLNESADLKKQADKYTELALKANKAGDEEKCKAFQKKVADIKNKMSKLEEESLSDIDIEHQDYKTMTDLEFKRAYNISKTDWFNKYKSLLIQRPDIKKALKIDENSVTHLRDREDLQAKQKALQDLQLDVNTHKDPELSSAVANRMDILMKQAKKLGIDESRAHEVLNTWFKNREIAQRAADQSPEERAEAEKKHAEQMKKDQQEYLKNNPNSIFKPMDEDSSVPTTPGTPTTPTTPTTGTPTTNTSGNQANTAMLATTTTSTDPAVKAAAAKAATGLNALKSAVGGQVNPQKMADTINKISTNKPVNQNDLKSIAPIVSTIGKAVTNPTDANKISSDLRTIFQQFKKNS